MKARGGLPPFHLNESGIFQIKMVEILDASSEIGKEMALQLASGGANLGKT